MSKFKVPIKHIRTGLEAVQRKHDNEEYDDLAVATYNSFEKGNNPEAPLIPYVRFVLDATLASLERHGPAGKVNEVRDRAVVAATYARAIDSFAFQDKNKPFFANLYNKYPILSEMMLDSPNIGRALMTDREYASSLAASPFSDVSIATGGVVRFLKNRHGIQKEKARSIALASEQLGIIGSIPKALAARALQTLMLGSAPYIDASHLTLEGNAVVPNSEMKDYMRVLGAQVPNSGCPAGRISYDTARGKRVNIMRHAWTEIASYLLTKNPTADATQ